jgi:hypothetical protein
MRCAGSSSAARRGVSHRWSDHVARWLTPAVVVAALAAVAAAGLAGCGEDLPSVDCTTPAVPTFAMVNAFHVSCTTCHSSTLTGSARFGAPPEVNFDVYESAASHAEEAARRVFSGSMPRQGSLAAADKEVLYRWALCGTPP